MFRVCGCGTGSEWCAVSGRESMYRRSVGRRAAGASGFTLIETLVALSVLAVAVTVFVGLFSRSLSLGRLAQDRTIAAEAAQAQLALMQRTPGAFLWKLPADGGDAAFPIQLAEDDPKAGNPIGMPSALPADEAASRRASTAYEQFRWHAEGRLPKDKAHVEVTVIVTWQDGGRPQMLALTSAVPRSAVEGHS